MVAKWNPAVLAITWRRLGSLVSLLVLGMAVCCPWDKSGIACGKTKLGLRSGFSVRLRYLVHQLVSRVSLVRFVSRNAPLEPVAVLPGKVRNCSRSTDRKSVVEGKEVIH